MRKLFLIFFIISPCLLFGQSTTENIESYKYLIVSASSGLRGREAPNLNSKVLDTIPYGTCIFFYGRTKDKDTIDGVTDYWYYTYTDDPFYENNVTNARELYACSIWFFGGYLTEYLENNIFVGRWMAREQSGYQDNSERRKVYIFSLNNKVYYKGLLRFDVGGFIETAKGPYDLEYLGEYTGTYERKNNDLKLNYSTSFYHPINYNKTKKAKIKIINTNTMQLIFDDGETVNLKRDNISSIFERIDD